MGERKEGDWVCFAGFVIVLTIIKLKGKETKSRRLKCMRRNRNDEEKN